MNIYTDNDSVIDTAEIIPYVYKLTHKITGQFYYGCRHYNVKLKLTPENDLWKKYFSSSDYIEKIIKNEGKDIFCVEIIFTNSNPETCNLYEQKLIEKNKHNKLILNKHYQKEGSNVFMTSGPLSDEHKAKISEFNAGKTLSKEHKAKIGEAHKDRIFTKEHKNNIKISKENISDETRNKMSESGKIKIFSEEHRENMSKAQTGRKHSPETLLKMSESHHNLPEETKVRLLEIKRNYRHSSETLLKMSESMKGKNTGPLSDEHKAKLSDALKGKSRSPEAKENMSKAQFY